MKKREFLALLSLGIFTNITGASSINKERKTDTSDAQVVKHTGHKTPVAQTIEDTRVHTRGTINKTSWYKHGKITANGEKFNPLALTTAHRTLPFNTIVRLTNPDNNKTVMVRVNDRGPYIKGRTYDVTLGVARLLDFEEEGVVDLLAEVVHYNGVYT